MISLPVQITETTQAVRGQRQGEWTAADWEALSHDDGNRYEIIEGVLYVTTAPSNFHQWIVLRLYRHFGVPAEDRGLGFAAIAQIGVFMKGATPVQPDFLFIKTEHAAIIRDRRIFGVPDLVVEVMSPGSVDYDQGIKLEAYAAAGVPEYVVISPAERTVTHYRLIEPGRYHEGRVQRGSDIVAFDCLPGLEATADSLFAGAPDTTL
ncbi:MAG TPA: Uma2 family endonuclease [Candidatus Limnocylindrales bacterium]|nr:Uma2 family endonuclease [Candidatus Limnocylindrales bacterium]